jgi:hypothetical protein
MKNPGGRPGLSLVELLAPDDSAAPMRIWCPPRRRALLELVEQLRESDRIKSLFGHSYTVPF